MRKIKSVLATALAVVMSMSVAVPAFAAEATPDATEQPAAVVAEIPENCGGGDEGVMPLDTGGWCTEVKGIGSQYKDVAYAGNGFNCNVRLVMKVPVGYAIDVAMYSGGTMVWEEQNAFNGERIFWAGNNVTSIRVRARSILGGPSTVERTFNCGVDVFGTQ